MCQKPHPTFNLAYSRDVLVDTHAVGDLHGIIDLDNSEIVGYLTKPASMIPYSKFKPSHLAAFIYSYGMF